MPSYGKGLQIYELILDFLIKDLMVLKKNQVF